MSFIDCYVLLRSLIEYSAQNFDLMYLLVVKLRTWGLYGNLGVAGSLWITLYVL